MPGPGAENQPGLDELAGQPADIAPGAYQYRADREPDGNPPESWIGLMKFAGLPLNKAVDVNAPVLKKVLCGMIWEEVRQVRRVALAWNGSAEHRPKADEIAVTFFDAEAKGTIPTRGDQRGHARRGDDEQPPDPARSVAGNPLHLRPPFAAQLRGGAGEDVELTRSSPRRQARSQPAS